MAANPVELTVAIDHGECCVCFESLCIKEASVLTRGGWLPTRSSVTYTRPIPKRICRHFLCHECASTLDPKICPECRREFDAVVSVPDPLKKPMKWFHLVDHDQVLIMESNRIDPMIRPPDKNGTLNTQELADALKGMFPVEPRCLEKMIANKWSSWDSDGDGTIGADEFRNSVAPFLSDTWSTLQRRLEPGLPDLETQPKEWFRVWDEDGSGSLDRREIVRALVKTVPGTHECGGERKLLDQLDDIWRIIDPHGTASVSLEQFLAKGGLHDYLVKHFVPRKG